MFPKKLWTMGTMRLSSPVTLFALLCAVPLACASPAGGPGDESSGTGDGDSTGASAGPTTGDNEPDDPEVFPGLADEVEILIDNQGIPHIYASSDRDLFYAAGYQLAVDRLFQIDLMRRRAHGRGAEVLGAAKVDEDKISRLFDFKRWGTLDAARFKADAPDDYALFTAWVAGINDRIAEVNAGTAPLAYGFGPNGANYEPELWTNDDPFIVAKMIAFANSNVLEYEFLASVVARVTPDAFAAIELLRPGAEVFALPPEDRPDSGYAPLPDDANTLAATPRPKSQSLPADAAEQLQRMHRALSGFRIQGSNSWAVDGRFTADGRPLIANDPHQPLQSPSVMYAMHMNSADGGGSFDVAGFGFAGVPGVQLGHNRKVQWTATTGFADCMDLISVGVTGDGKTIDAGGKSAAITVRSEEIKVKDAPSVVVNFRDVEDYGVLLGDALPFPETLVVDPGRSLLIQWTGFRATNEAAAALAMSRAGNLREWERAVDKMEVGTFNWLGADKDGISYHLHTLVPDRGDPSHRQMPYLVVDGDVREYYWTGKHLPATKLPQSHAETTGYIVTANNDPFGFTADGNVHNDPWYYGTFYDPGYRAERITKELASLTAKGGITVADMQALQLDTYSGIADQLLPTLAEIYARVPSDDILESFRDRPELATLVKLLTVDWDRTMQQDQAGALAFHAFAHFLVTRIYRDDLLLTFSPIMEASPVTALKLTVLAATEQYENGDAVMQQGRDVLVMSALSDTAAWLTEEFGAVNPGMYSWGMRHGTGFRNPVGGALDGGWWPTHGGEDSVNVSSSVFYVTDTTDVRKQFESNDGAVFRLVTRFAPDGTPEATINFPRGNSGEPGSPHFDDTLDDWRDGVYSKLPFNRPEVNVATTEKFVLKP